MLTMSAPESTCLPGSSVVKNLPANVGDVGFDPWVGKVVWRRRWKPTPAFLPGESHGQRSLVGYIVHGDANSRTRLSYWAHTHAHTTIYNECGHPLCQEFSSFSLHSSPLEGWLKYNPGPHSWKLWFKRSGVGLEKVHFWQVTRGGTYCHLWYQTLWELLSCFVLGLLLVRKTNSCFIIEPRRC